jgi:hypothetical protein
MKSRTVWNRENAQVNVCATGQRKKESEADIKNKPTDYLRTRQFDTVDGNTQCEFVNRRTRHKAEMSVPNHQKD